jgi:2,5-diamino-6-(ribosylamino)-4(3H)-pyrimidinone 5'-phosphate reductase
MFGPAPSAAPARLFLALTTPFSPPLRRRSLRRYGDAMSHRPRVVVSVTATADGRTALSRVERLLDDDARRRWQSVWPPDVPDLLKRRAEAIEERHRPTVVLEGSGTFVADSAGPLDLPSPRTGLAADSAGPLGLPSLAAGPAADFLPVRSAKWFAVVDGRGRISWTHKQDGDTRLIVVVASGTPAAYLAHLRREAIPYLVAGADRVDLASALAKMRDELGAACVLSEAGGGLNGALLRAGLVDELHVITVPALAGGAGTPSVMDGPPLTPGASPIRLRTVNVTVGEHGSVWSHYEVVTDPGPPEPRR